MQTTPSNGPTHVFQVSCDGSKNPAVLEGELSYQIFSDMYVAVTELALAYYYSM